MSTLTLPNAKPVETRFNSKAVLSPVSTDDSTQVVILFQFKQPEEGAERGTNALGIAGVEFKLLEHINWKLILKFHSEIVLLSQNWVYGKSNQDIQETHHWKRMY